ncbi:hypothetical protein NDU88_007206 [Pleurodeles waltl]|uniref:Uncharacterized protein n=1 Tax=Pleurodeles waltl TaxID=8319 RepID=A0AAV7QQX3_PLEWA|nr:hypothetical protein NDU88_007206 [Pleurodeles waltl]
MVSVLWKREWLPEEYRQENRRNTPRFLSIGIDEWSASSGNASGSRKNTGKKTGEIPHGKYLGHFLGFIVK